MNATVFWLNLGLDNINPLKKWCFLLINSALVFIALSHSVVQAKELSIAIGFSLGPYAISNGRGVLVDVTTKVLEDSSDSVRFTYMSNQEALDAFKKGLFDAVAPAKPERGKFYYSDPVVEFHNIAISLKGGNVKLNSLQDLTKYRVAGFSGASYFLGQKFLETILQNDKYIEVANQETQVLMLFQGDVDIVIADQKIFQFYLKKLLKGGLIQPKSYPEFQLHDVFPSSVYVVGFHDENACDSFNRGLKKLKASGEYDAIYNKYSRLVDNY